MVSCKSQKIRLSI